MSAVVDSLVEKYTKEFPDASTEVISAMIGAYFDGKADGFKEAKEQAKIIISGNEPKQTYSIRDDNSPLGSNPFMDGM